MPPSASTPQIQRAVARPFVAFVRSLGVDPAPYAVESGMPVDVLRESTSFMDERALYAFLELVSTSLDVADLGIVAAENSTLHDLGPFGLRLLQSCTLDHLLRRFVELVNDVSTEAKWWLRHDGEQTWICRGSGGLFDVGEAQAEQYVVALMVQMVRLVESRSWVPDVVHVREAELPASGLGSLLGRSTVRGRQRVTAIVLPRRLLRRRLPSGPSSPVVARLRAFVEARAGAPPSLQEAAELAGRSGRSLQRDLEGVGLTYRQLVGQVQFQIAADLMESGGLPLGEIAESLGFREPSSFTRSFRRWAGVSPSEFRRQE